MPVHVYTWGADSIVQRRQPNGRERLAEFVVRWLVTAAAVWVAAAMLDGVDLEGWGSTLFVALILGLLNAFIRPLLFWLSLPFTVVTLGVFVLVLNAAMLGLTAWLAGKFDDVHFAVDGFWPAFFGGLVISVVSFVVTRFVNPRDVARRFR